MGYQIGQSLILLMYSKLMYMRVCACASRFAYLMRTQLSNLSHFKMLHVSLGLLYNMKNCLCEVDHDMGYICSFYYYSKTLKIYTSSSNQIDIWLMQLLVIFCDLSQLTTVGDHQQLSGCMEMWPGQTYFVNEAQSPLVLSCLDQGGFICSFNVQSIVGSILILRCSCQDCFDI